MYTLYCEHALMSWNIGPKKQLNSTFIPPSCATLKTRAMPRYVPHPTSLPNPISFIAPGTASSATAQCELPLCLVLSRLLKHRHVRPLSPLRPRRNPHASPSRSQCKAGAFRQARRRSVSQAHAHDRQRLWDRGGGTIDRMPDGMKAQGTPRQQHVIYSFCCTTSSSSSSE